MGLFDKSKDSHLDEKYRKYLQKEKGYKALQCLEKRVELGYSELSAARLGRAYYSGVAGTYFKGHILKRVKCERDMEKARHYFEIQLARYGSKVKSVYSDLQFRDNMFIGWFKTYIAMTCQDKDPQGYLEYIRDAALTNQFPEALGRYAEALGEEYEKYGLEQNIEQAVALYILGHRQYISYGMRGNAEYLGFDLLGPSDEWMFLKLKKYAQQSKMAQVYVTQYTLEQKKKQLEARAARMELEMARVSLLNELDDKINWYYKGTDEKVPDINKAIQDMEKELERLYRELEAK